MGSSHWCIYTPDHLHRASCIHLILVIKYRKNINIMVNIYSQTVYPNLYSIIMTTFCTCIIKSSWIFFCGKKKTSLYLLIKTIQDQTIQILT
jgi:hypothetical protein